MKTIQERLRSYSLRSGYAKYCHAAADRIDALENEMARIRELWEADQIESSEQRTQIHQLRAQVETLTKDAERLDHIQVTGSTVELVNFGQKPVQHSFRVGGLYKAINFDLRLAIDAAIKESK